VSSFYQGREWRFRGIACSIILPLFLENGDRYSIGGSTPLIPSRLPGQLPMNIKLLCIEADVPDFEITLDELPVRVGRHQDVRIQIQDQWISRLHCEIDHIGGTLEVRDLGSRHGVFVNGFHVVQAHLMPDDRLTIGMTSFRVDYECEVAEIPSR